jgi:hypothetical protein
VPHIVSLIQSGCYNSNHFFRVHKVRMLGLFTATTSFCLGAASRPSSAPSICCLLEFWHRIATTRCSLGMQGFVAQTAAVDSGGIVPLTDIQRVCSCLPSSDLVNLCRCIDTDLNSIALVSCLHSNVPRRMGSCLTPPRYGRL